MKSVLELQALESSEPSDRGNGLSSTISISCCNSV
jgi:hypothetical protein